MIEKLPIHASNEDHHHKINSLIDAVNTLTEKEEKDPMSDLCFCDKSEFPHSRHTPQRDITIGDIQDEASVPQELDVEALLEEYKNLHWQNMTPEYAEKAKKRCMDILTTLQEAVKKK